MRSALQKLCFQVATIHPIATWEGGKAVYGASYPWRVHVEPSSKRFTRTDGTEAQAHARLIGPPTEGQVCSQDKITLPGETTALAVLGVESFPDPVRRQVVDHVEVWV